MKDTEHYFSLLLCTLMYKAAVVMVALHVMMYMAVL